MSLKCQKDSYVKEFLTNVKSCKPAKTKVVVDGKKTSVDGFNIILEDTILFPEGGGQPEDKGRLNDLPVLSVIRRGSEAVHFTQGDLEVGLEVKVTLDWDRRFEHMQQHTAQHLVTAITDRKFGFQTTSWDMGTEVVTIELDTPTVTGPQLREVEDSVNEYIRNSVPVSPSFYQDRNDPELKKFRGLGLPEDHEGVVRVLTIRGIDTTLCCGTHVKCLSHIQAIKIVGSEKGKKGKTNVMFLAGGRLLRYTNKAYDREKKMTGILKGQPEKHCELAEKAVKSLKALQKTCLTQSRELASLEASMFKQAAEQDKVFVKFRRDGDNDYVLVLLSELEDPDLPKLVSTGNDKEGGSFVLAGTQDLVQNLGPKICQVFEGKGAPSKGVFRGKTPKPESRLAKAEKLLRDYLANPNCLEDMIAEDSGTNGKENGHHNDTGKDEKQPERSEGHKDSQRDSDIEPTNLGADV